MSAAFGLISQNYEIKRDKKKTLLAQTQRLFLSTPQQKSNWWLDPLYHFKYMIYYYVYSPNCDCSHKVCFVSAHFWAIKCILYPIFWLLYTDIMKNPKSKVIFGCVSARCLRTEFQCFEANNGTVCRPSAWGVYLSSRQRHGLSRSDWKYREVRQGAGGRNSAHCGDYSHGIHSTIYLLCHN